jgi:beta-glucanase (GH16 family)
MKYITGIMLALLISSVSCGKNDNSQPAPAAPANLVLHAVVNADKSGSVAFTASADNAVSYDYDFGNGVYKTVANGIINYTYTGVGQQTYNVKVTAKSAAGLTASKAADITVIISPALVWSDEFNTDGAPDPTKWGYDIGTGDNGWGNEEKQYYTNRSQNVSVANGVLKINVIKESYSGSNYTSTRMLTKDKFAFTYGKIEVSAKLPAGGGTWPAIWMLGSNITTAGWPACGEIDIMEHKGNEPNKIYGTVHHPNHAGGNADGGTVMIQNETTAFHKYALDWSPTVLRFYVDDQLFYSFNNTNNLPFNHDFFVILNFAMGGHFGGAIDPAFNGASMEVDYVRVYRN